MASSENWFSRRKGKHGVDLFKLDTKNKTPEQNIVDIIQGLYLKKPFQTETSPSNKSAPLDYRSGLRGMQRNGSDSRRLSYLNALVTLICKEDKNKLGFTTEELMTCLRISLVDDSVVIRAAALRVLRYLIKTESDVATFNHLRLPYLIIRSMEIMVRNEEERAQALRVVRRVAGAAVGLSRTGAARPEPALLRCLAALACDPASLARELAADRLSRPAAATLAEICVLHPELFVWCGGVSAISRQLGECATPRMAEALCGVLLHTLNEPSTRVAARVDLLYLTAPYCDFHVRPPGTDSSRDEREMRFTCSRLALLCVLRSWPGILHFCHPNFPGGLHALVAALYLPRLEVRKAILDLLYELVGLPQPEWTDEISVALGAVDPSDFQDSWRLNEGFVAAEGNAILPHLGATGPDITEIHLALLLQCFLEAGLLESLAEVIVTSDTFISVRATVLVGQLVHLAHSYLPPEVWAGCGAVAALPALTRAAATGRPQALAAVAALRSLLGTLHARPASATLFLDHVLLCCGSAFSTESCSVSPAHLSHPAQPSHPANPTHLTHTVQAATDDPPPNRDSIEFLESDETELKQRHSVGSRADVCTRNVSALVKSKSVSSRTSAAVSKVAKSAKFFNIFERDSDSLIRCTFVMQNKDGNTWDWEIIRTILKEDDGTPFFNLNDSFHKVWAARIINYLKPSSNKYSHTDLTSTCNGHSATRAGCQLIRHLLKHNDTDSQKLLEDFFSDVSHQIEAIETGVKAHECLFSPQHMCNTMCQMYFLFIGQLCHTRVGLKMFKRTGLYDNLLELSTKTHHSCYVKLIISSLDYTIGSFPRDILVKTLTCNIQASRLYATQFLNVLLRASRKSHELLRRKTKSKKSFMHEYAQSSPGDCGDGDSFVDMETWILQLLVGQVKDDSKAVVKVALAILEEAFCVPALVEKLIPMRETLCQNCRLDKHSEPASLDFTAVGDKGYLLWLTLEVAATQLADTISMTFIKKHLDFWTKSYNYRYTRLVEAGTHEALALSETGGTRSAARARRAARPPHHLHAALAQHHRARALLNPVLPLHYKVLQHKKCTTEQEIADVKASLWAVGNTAVTGAGLQLLMSLSSGYLEDSVLVHIVRLVKYNPVYSVRATAFYVLSLIGSTYDGANLLADLGWLCVRHTRNDQFPLTPDETLSLHDQNVNHFVTSPDSRFNTYDAEMSEHSDHTDQSVAESSHSEHKYFGKVGSVLEQSDQDVDYKATYNDNRRDHDKRKSHTLPTQGLSSSHDRPMLSESRTVDILRDYSSYDRTGSYRTPVGDNRLLMGRINSLDHTHEGRIRNTSESSTSGVSSCDSFVGKYTMPDRILTLSPIPSSSSLYGMKGSNIPPRPKMPELQRRTSTSSYTGNDAANSPPTHMDMTGYATIKSLNRRPHLSESAVIGSSEIDDLSWLLSDPIRRSKPFSSLRDKSKSARERIAKLSLLEYDWKPLPQCEKGRSSPSTQRAPAPSATVRPRSRPAPGPGYIGICLPRNLIDIFPKDDEKKEHDVVDNVEHSKPGVSSFLADTSVASADKSRITPDGFKSSLRTSVLNVPKYSKTDSNVVGNFGWKNAIAAQTFDPSVIKETAAFIASKTDSLIENNANELPRTNETVVASETNTGGAEESSVRTLTEENVIPLRDEQKSEASACDKNKWHHAIGNCIACVRTRPPSAYELREAFFAGMDVNTAIGSDCCNSTSSSVTADGGTDCPQAELLKQVQLMANPLHLRQTRSVILSLKQRHPDIFRSPCVYSDVCALLARDTYMLCARRFLQELFSDTSFECFAGEPIAILARHGAVVSPTATTPTDQHK